MKLRFVITASRMVDVRKFVHMGEAVKSARFSLKFMRFHLEAYMNQEVIVRGEHKIVVRHWQRFP